MRNYTCPTLADKKDDPKGYQMDKTIANACGIENPWAGTFIRGIFEDVKYEEGNQDFRLTPENLEDYLDEIKKTYSNMLSLDKLRDYSKTSVDSYIELREIFTAKEFNEVIGGLTHICSAILDMQEQKGLPREALVHNPITTKRLLSIIKGYTLNGNSSARYPSTNILGYKEALNAYITNPNEQNHRRVLLYSKILQNWNSLERFIVFKLAEIENIDPKDIMRNLNQESVYSANEVNNEEYDDESVDQFFFADESVREGWMITNDFINSFGSLSKRVKQILGRIPSGDNEQTILGTPKYLDPVITYQTIQYLCKHMRDSEHMVELLKGKPDEDENSAASRIYSYISNIFEPQEGDDARTIQQKKEFRTQFFVNLKKSFERYTLSVQQKDKSNNRWYSVALNIISKKDSVTKWKTNIKLRLFKDGFILAKTPDRAQKIEAFKKEVNDVLESKHTPQEEADIKALKSALEQLEKRTDMSVLLKAQERTKLRSKLNALTSEDVYAKFTYYGAATKMSTLARRKARLKSWMDALGIQYTEASIDEMLKTKNRRLLTSFLKQLKEFCDDTLEEGKLGSTSILKNKELVEAMEKLAKAASPFQEESHEHYISRITQKQGKRTSTRSSFINPSFLSDFVDTVQSFVDDGEAIGKPQLVEYLADVYLKNPQFIFCKADPNMPLYTKEEIMELLEAYRVNDNTSIDDIENFIKADSLEIILNPWIKELLLSNLDSEDSYAAHLRYTKNIGSKDQVFEDFSDKQHCAMMFNTYTYTNPNKVRYISKQEALDRIAAWKEKKSTITIDGKNEATFISSSKYNMVYYIEGTNKGLTVKNGKLTLVDRTDYSLYPMFVMGDAGVYKSFCGRRYTEQEIKDYLWDVYQQEHQKAIMLHEAHQQWLEEGGTDKNFLRIYKNAFPKEGIYSFKNTVLSYFGFGEESLSEIEGNINLANGSVFLNTEDGRKAFNEKIGRVFERKTEETRRKLIQKGLLGEKNGNYFNPPFPLNGTTAAEKNEEIDAKIGDFVRNSAFAGIQQFQLFTIDIQHYKDVKDLQKRYKEIHAPGTELDVKAGLELEGFNRDYETFGYFQDVIVNIENLDALNESTQHQYMQMLLEHHCLPNKKVLVSEMINQGITVPDYVMKDGKPLIENGAYVLHDKNHREGSKEYRYTGIDGEVKSYYGEEGRTAILKDLLGNNYRRVYEPYLKTTLTDGQAYRTIDSYRAIMVMSGKWSLQKEHNPLEQVYQELLAFRANRESLDQELPEDLRRKLISFNKALQPTKPYTYGFEMFKTKNFEIPIPVQHKCAEVVVIPELCAKGKLKTMMQWAEANGVDMMCSTEVAKVGCYGQVDISHVTPEKEETVEEAIRRLLDDSGKTIHSIPYKYYRLQTNVPEHVNASNGIGTQLRKLFYNKINKAKSYKHYTAGLPNDRGGVFTLDGKTEMNLNGSGLIKLYNALNMAEILTSLKKVKSRISDRKRFVQDYCDNILMQPRESKDRLLSFQTDKWGHFRQSIADPTIEHDVSSTMISWFKKKVLKQQISGGSAVQASAMGLSYIMEDWKEDDGGLHIIYDNEGNPIEAECEIMWDFKYVDSEGNEQILDFDDYCNADGTLKTNEQGVPLLDVDFPKIREMIAYRIPTENDYSVIRLKAVKFTPKINGGGTIKVPAHFTTIAGFDFDVDKLYFMRTEFKELRPRWENFDITKEQRDQIVAKIRELHPEFVKEVPAVTEESFNKEQLYDIFAVIYEEEPAIAADLRKIRPEGDKTPLNQFFEKSTRAKAMAERKGFASVRDYKQFLVQKAAEQLEYTPETLVTVKNGYLALDKEAISAKGLTASQLYKEAAEKAGITLKRKSGKKLFEEYHFDRTPMENTGVARRNLMVELIKARWSDKEVLADKTIPGGFFNSIDASHMILELKSNASKWLSKAFKGKTGSEIYFDDVVTEITKSDWEDPSAPLDAIDIWTILKYNQDNQLAAKLIGIFANHTNNAVFSSLMSEFKINDPSLDITFGSLIDAEIVDADGNVLESTENRHGSSFLTEYIRIKKDDGTTEIRSTTNTIIEFLAASVDAVKNPVLNVLNLTTMTAGIGATLARLGYHPYDIALLLNQPIVKQIVEYGKSNNVRSLQNCVDSVLRRNNWLKKGEDYNKMDLDTHPTSNTMAYNVALYETMTPESYVANEDLRRQQLGIVKLLTQINTVATEMNEFIANTKNTAANSVTSTFGGFFSREQRIEQYLAKRDTDSAVLSMQLLPKEDYQEKTDKFDNTNPITRGNSIKEDVDAYIIAQANNPFGIEQTMFDSYTDFIHTIAKMTPYMSSFYYIVRNFFASLTSNKYLDEPTINAIHYEIPAFILSRMLSPFNGDALYVSPNTGEYVKNADGRYMTNREYYLEEFPIQVLRHKKQLEKSGKLNLFWSHITVDSYNDKTDKVSIKFKDMGSLESGQIDELKSGWEACNEEIDNMAQDLVMYSFYKNGLSFGPTSLISLAPVNVLNSIIVYTTEEGIPVNYFEFFNGKYDEDEDGKMRTLVPGLLQGNYQNIFGLEPTLREFFLQFCLNHSDNYSLVWEAKGDDYTELSKKFFTKDENQQITGSHSEVVVDVSSNDNKALNHLVLNTKKDEKGVIIEYQFRPVILLNGVIYVARNPFDGTERSADGTMIYYRVNRSVDETFAYGYNEYVAPTTNDVIGMPNLNNDKNLETQDIKALWDKTMEAMGKAGLPTQKLQELRTVSALERQLKEAEDAVKLNICRISKHK